MVVRAPGWVCAHAQVWSLPVEQGARSPCGGQWLASGYARQGNNDEVHHAWGVPTNGRATSQGHEPHGEFRRDTFEAVPNAA